MNSLNPKRATVFIVVFFIIALCINSTQRQSNRTQQTTMYVAPVVQQSPQPAPPQQSEQQRLEIEREANAKIAAENAAAEHARYLERYLNGGFSRTSGSETLAIVVATDDGKLDHAVTTALIQHFKTATVEISSSFFKPEFVSDKLFDEVFNGSASVLNKLELAHSLDGLLLARLTIKYSTNPSLENVTTANMQLEIVTVPIARNVQNQTWTFTANGAGFRQADARSMAEDRLIKQITNDTKMSLR